MCNGSKHPNVVGDKHIVETCRRKHGHCKSKLVTRRQHGTEFERFSNLLFFFTFLLLFLFSCDRIEVGEREGGRERRERGEGDRREPSAGVFIHVACTSLASSVLVF